MLVIILFFIVSSSEIFNFICHPLEHIKYSYFKDCWIILPFGALVSRLTIIYCFLLVPLAPVYGSFLMGIFDSVPHSSFKTVHSRGFLLAFFF